MDPIKLAKVEIPIATGWLLGDCMEARGKQDLWTRKKPEVLAALREQSIIQSVESSNRIEGVTVAAGRLRPLALGAAKPRDRSEEELAGYRGALDWIFTRKNKVRIEADTIRRLHRMAQGGASGDAGEWKKRDNEIVEILPGGLRRVRFVAVAAKNTPKAVDLLCSSYQRACERVDLPPLLTIACFVLDFLCIHPFRDGNGRVSRLMTTLLLESHGFKVARYISLERLVEDSKHEYYSVLKTCSQGWHEGKNPFLPWWNYFLGIVRSAYKEFEQRIESMEARPAKSELVRQTVMEQLEPFSLSTMQAQLPSVSPQLIKKVLGQMKQEGTTRLRGRGRGAEWEFIRRRRAHL